MDTQSTNGVLADWTNPTVVDAWWTNGVLADWANPTVVDAWSTNGVLADRANPTILLYFNSLDVKKMLRGQFFTNTKIRRTISIATSRRLTRNKSDFMLCKTDQ